MAALHNSASHAPDPKLSYFPIDFYVNRIENSSDDMITEATNESLDTVNEGEIMCDTNAEDEIPSDLQQHDAQYFEDGLSHDVYNIRKSYLNHTIISHLNVNSLGSKIMEIKEMQLKCKFDVLVLSETKLDGSYKQDIIDIDGYSCIRQDKRSNSGGLITYISKDIPHSPGTISICNDELECMSIELNISGDKIMLLGMYKNPRTDPVIFKRFF